MPDRGVWGSPKWSKLSMWHEPEMLTEGRYELETELLHACVCRLCGAMLAIGFTTAHDVYHEEQGY